MIPLIGTEKICLEMIEMHYECTTDALRMMHCAVKSRQFFPFFFCTQRLTGNKAANATVLSRGPKWAENKYLPLTGSSHSVLFHTLSLQPLSFVKEESESDHNIQVTGGRHSFQLPTLSPCIKLFNL